MNKLAFIFPGQGAQYPGMGRDFFDQYEEARAVFEEADALLEKPFSELIFNGPSEELTLTKNSQLAIFITSIAILRVVQAKCPNLTPASCAGLSLGEYTALVAAEKLSFKEALILVQARGQFMQDACISHPGTMHVVLGLDLPTIEKTLSPIGGVWIANLNCPGQIVLSGTVEGIKKAASALKEKGARRVLPLDVSGAFHSGLMQEAQDRLSPFIEKTILESSDIAIAMNAPGTFVDAEKDMRDAMIAQVTQPVRWQRNIEAMTKQGVTLFIEMGPGKTLASMNKRIGVDAQTLSVEKMEDLQVLLEKGAEYATT